MTVLLRNGIAGEWYKLTHRRFFWAAIAATSLTGLAGAVAPRIEEKIASVQQHVAGGGASASEQNAFVYLTTGLKGTAILAGLFVALAAATACAGEAASGTLRIALARPMSRARCYAAKFIALALFMECLVLAGGLSAAAGAGFVADYGPAVRIIVKNTFGELAARSAFALLVSQVALFAVLSFAFLTSVVSRSAATANAAALGTLVLASLAAVAVEPAKSYIFSAFATSPFDVLRSLALGQDAPRPTWFGMPSLQDWADITFAVALPGAFAFLFGFVGLRIFMKRDWLS
jgi:ABC-type transport system involved in multi-copper enzyme maturation permease subunit